jgi:hypothetical protein
LIIAVEQLIFEFRIYVELDAETTDVRLTEEASSVQPDPTDLFPDSFTYEQLYPTAYDRSDDRTFPEPSCDAQG